MLLVAGEGLFDDRDGGIGGADFLNLDLFTLELLVVLKKAFEDEQAMTGKIAGFEVFAEFGVVGGDGDDFVVGGAAVDHGHDADSAGLDESERLNGLLAEDEHVERVVVFGVGLRDEAVVGGIKNGGVDDAIDFEQTGGLVEFVFEIGTEGNFDDGLEVAGDFFAWRNVVPRVDQEYFLAGETDAIIACQATGTKLENTVRCGEMIAGPALSKRAEPVRRSRLDEQTSEAPPCLCGTGATYREEPAAAARMTRFAEEFSTGSV